MQLLSGRLCGLLLLQLLLLCRLLLLCLLLQRLLLLRRPLLPVVSAVQQYRPARPVHHNAASHVLQLLDQKLHVGSVLAVAIQASHLGSSTEEDWHPSSGNAPASSPPPLGSGKAQQNCAAANAQQ